MKNLCFIFLISPLTMFAQWNATANSYSTGGVYIDGSFQSTANYGLVLAPASGDAIIKRNTPGTLFISSGGGTSEIRLNYNYGGGSGGVSIFDGGTTNYANFKISSSGDLAINSNGNKVGIGTYTPQNNLDVMQWFGSSTETRIFAGQDHNFGANSGRYGIGMSFEHIDGTSQGKKFHISTWFAGGLRRSMTIDYLERVGIGTTSPQAKLHVHDETNLPQAVGSYHLLERISGRGHNHFMKNTWMVRDASTTTQWWTTRLHDGISIDASYLTPGVDTRTWWERDPNDNIQSWGDGSQTYLTINQGSVGVGTTTPQKKLHVSGSGDVEQWIEATDDGYASLSLKSNGKKWHWSKRPGTAQDALQLYFHNGANWSAPFISILPDGRMGVGSTFPDSKLTVKGTIHAEEVKVDLSVPGPDYVFGKDYDLLSLSEVEAFINQHKHLPEVPSAKQMEEEGLNLKEMNLILLKKVEELTLHLIQQQKEIELLKSKLK